MTVLILLLVALCYSASTDVQGYCSVCVYVCSCFLMHNGVGRGEERGGKTVC